MLPIVLREVPAALGLPHRFRRPSSTSIHDRRRPRLSCSWCSSQPGSRGSGRSASRNCGCGPFRINGVHFATIPAPIEPPDRNSSFPLTRARAQSAPVGRRETKGRTPKGRNGYALKHLALGLAVVMAVPAAVPAAQAADGFCSAVHLPHRPVCRLGHPDRQRHARLPHHAQRARRRHRR